MEHIAAPRQSHCAAVRVGPFRNWWSSGCSKALRLRRRASGAVLEHGAPYKRQFLLSLSLTSLLGALPCGRTLSPRNVLHRSKKPPDRLPPLASGLERLLLHLLHHSPRPHAITGKWSGADETAPRHRMPDRQAISTTSTHHTMPTVSCSPTLMAIRSGCLTCWPYEMHGRTPTRPRWRSACPAVGHSFRPGHIGRPGRLGREAMSAAPTNAESKNEVELPFNTLQVAWHHLGKTLQPQ